MSKQLKTTIDHLLQQVVSSNPRVPGVVAMATNKNEIIYEGSAGVRSLAGNDPMTTDSVFAIFSTTKAITATACLQLVEEGKLDLDAPAKEYVPSLGEIKVLEGFDADGQPILRNPKSEITTKMLLLHTAGFGYDFFNENYKHLTHELGYPNIVSASKACITTPLLFDPGTKWEYGTNMDWAGQVVEGITGKRLGEVMKERIFDPLGMNNSTFSLTPEMDKKRAVIHQRNEDGSLTPMPDFVLPTDPEVHMGGHGLYSTVGDYMKFIQMWLNDGSGANGNKVLAKKTVEMAEKNHLGDLKITMLPGVIAALSNDAEFFPGMPKSWAFSFMVNEEEAPTGRPAGSLAWAGLANLYYWIDRKNGVGGYYATQILPFADATAVGNYFDFEKAVYDHYVKK